MTTFTVGKEHFELDGQPFQVLSGAMHYFRVRPEAWADRMRKMRLMGLNTLETYVAWNLHEPRPGEFDFSGPLDLAAYIRLAAVHGLYVIVRPGPYICAEWEMGGLPAWLLREPDMRLRCSHRPYLAAVERYFDALLSHLTPLQVTHGGPILAMQVENEYGSYGDDQAYLLHLENALRARGVDTLLFTADGPWEGMFLYGSVPHIFKTANFGSDVPKGLAVLREHQPTGPLMCMEFWNGWFDAWGESHHLRPPEDAAAVLDDFLRAGASVNFYMAHGGTTFGFMNGANCDEAGYRPTINSYDYDAPISEAGDLTPKFMAFREVIGRYAPVPPEPLPASTPKLALEPVALTGMAPLLEHLDQLSAPVQRVTPEPMEMLGQNYGFILYRTQLPGPREQAKLQLVELHDRAQVFLDNQPLGCLEREFPDRTLAFATPADGAQLDLLVENMGRVNYGLRVLDRKGITEAVLLGGRQLFDWTIYPLPLDDLTRLTFQPLSGPVSGPAFYRGTFTVPEPLDTFLALPGWTKGVCWVNGFNLGRYWQRGPQQTLYVPGSLLRLGRNELIVLELHGAEHPTVSFLDHPLWGTGEAG